MCVIAALQDNGAIAGLMNNIGVLYLHDNKPQQAPESMTNAVAMFTRLHGKKSPMPPSVIRGTYNLAHMYERLGDEVQARAMLVLSKAMLFEADVRSGNTVASTPQTLRSSFNFD